MTPVNCLWKIIDVTCWYVNRGLKYIPRSNRSKQFKCEENYTYRKHLRVCMMSCIINYIRNAFQKTFLNIFFSKYNFVWKTDRKEDRECNLSWRYFRDAVPRQIFPSKLRDCNSVSQIGKDRAVTVTEESLFNRVVPGNALIDAHRAINRSTLM